MSRTIDPAPARIPALDGLRALAVLAILILHFFVRVPVPPDATAVRYLLQALGLTFGGVDLFFVLSGFLIGGILLDHRDSPNLFPVFYARRFFRIVPVYVLLLLSYHWGRATSGLNTANFGTYFDSPVPVWTYWVFGQNIAMGWLNDFGNYWLSPTWSLGVEEQFYLLMPFAVRLLSRRALVTGCVAIVLISPVLRWIALERTQNAYAAIFLLPMRADGLMAGVLCAVAMRSPTAVEFLRARLRGMILLAVLLGAGLAGLSIGGHGATSPLVVGFGYSAMAVFFSLLLILVLLQPGSIFARTLSVPLLGFIGRTSYFVYLAHLPVWYWLHWFIRGKAPTHLTGLAVAVTCLAAAATFALAALSWRCLEQPLLRLGRRFHYRQGSTPGKA